MSKLTTKQSAGYAVATATSTREFRNAQRKLPVGWVRNREFAAQGMRFVAAVDALGIDRTHATVARDVQLALSHTARAARDDLKRGVSATVAAAAASDAAE
jgi:hypothetical protein